MLGHRGYRSLAPENTLPSFLAALEHRADGVEFDVQKEPGGAYVVVHDPPGHDGAAPRLAAVLAGLPRGIYLDVELKGETLSPADCPRILAELTAAGIDIDRMMISSFIAELLPPWKAWGIETALLLGSEAMRMGIPRLVALVRRIRPTWLNPAVQAFSVLGRPVARLAFRLVRLAGLRLAFWTVNTDEQLRDASRFADIVICDDVDRAMAFFPKAAGPTASRDRSSRGDRRTVLLPHLRRCAASTTPSANASRRCSPARTRSPSATGSGSRCSTRPRARPHHVRRSASARTGSSAARRHSWRGR